MTPVPSAPRSCIACGTPPRRGWRLRNGAWLWRCPRCLLGWWDWPAFDPQAFYDQSYFQSAEQAKGYDDYASLVPGLERTAAARLRRIESLLTRCGGGSKVPRSPRSLGMTIDARALAGGGTARTPADSPRLLEIGCGTGVFLDVAWRAGWEVSGVEVSAYAAEQARRRGHSVSCEPVESLRLAEGAYDCIALWDVVEHLRDPAGVLAEAARALRPGGVLALSTGDIGSLCARLTGPRWHLFNLPEHLFFFTTPSLRQLLERAGCRVVRVTREVNWLPAAYVLERLEKTAASGGLLHRVLAAAAAMRVGGLVVPATVFDVLGVYAVRR